MGEEASRRATVYFEPALHAAIRLKAAHANRSVNDLRAFATQDVTRILRRIRSLADDPRPAGCEKLSGLDRYRVRQVSFRIIYEIEDRRLVVLIVKVGHGRDACCSR